MTVNLRRLRVAGVLALALGLCPAPAAHAQTTLNVEAGLDGYFRSQRWMPLRVRLTNAGGTARVEVRAKFATGDESMDEYRLPERELQSPSDQTHTLYVKAPDTLTTQPFRVDLFKDGRSINLIRPRVSLVDETNWLVVGIGTGDAVAQLKNMTTLRLGPGQLAPGARQWMGNGQQSTVTVGTLEPAAVPDRWQGLAAADMVVLTNVGESDFKPEQIAALRDFVSAGGVLAVAATTNWNRLTTPLFRELLPVTVTGSRVATSLPELGGLVNGPSPSGAQYTLLESRPKPGAIVKVEHEGQPVVAFGQYGAGRVLYLGIDPAQAPFSNWNGRTDLWKELMLRQPEQRILSLISAGDNPETTNPYNNNGAVAEARLANAPYAISQLDIPAFYVVALFLLAYILALVPVNYFLLRRFDKKEYAWLTTPLIVAGFSFVAFVIGYGFKGGQTLLVKVGVIEARAGAPAAPSLVYMGLFSPRKTGYDVELASNDPAAKADASATLLSEPRSNHPTPGTRVLEGDYQRIEDFAVDMWAMRVLKAEGQVRLGKGITATLRRKGQRLEGKLRNDSAYSLEGCRLVSGGQSIPLDAVLPGREVTLPPISVSPSATGTLLPPTMLSEIQGTSQQARMKRAVLQPLCTGGLGNVYGQAAFKTPPHPLLVGWVKEPVDRVLVNGGTPREQAVTLMIVHLDGNGNG